MSTPRSFHPSRPYAGFTAYLVLAASFLGAACNKGSGAAAPSLFDAPGDVELVCFDDNSDGRVLPRRCCDDPDLASDDAESEGERDPSCAGTTPHAHALVTQTLRGEVGAVDLVEEKVIDSQRSIPGYTFIDVGGQPTAVVVPPVLPTASETADGGVPSGDAGAPEPEGDAGDDAGVLPPPVDAPVFTYVAGREMNDVRALATCRFRNGRGCAQIASEDAQKQLAGAPQGMVLEPGGRALWVSLPDLGLLARVKLGTDGVHPFAEEAPAYFPLAADVDVTPPEPVEEGSSYVATCGLGYTFNGNLPRMQLPFAPRASSSLKPHPTRLSFVEVAPGEALLFVVDDGQSLIHALAVQGEQLEQRALLPIGAPLRDFAVTPAVPEAAPDAARLTRAADESSPDAWAYRDATFTTDTKRYLYGVDARDGSVMVFELGASAGVPSIRPLLAPIPARDTVRRFGNFSDRLWLGSDGASARTLSVVDTRQQLLPGLGRDAEWRFDGEFCGEKDQAGRQADRDAAKSEYEKALNDPKAKRDYLLAQHRLDVIKAANDTDNGPSALRGVFVMVALSNGFVVTLDVHDLDLQCRARNNCDADDPTKLRTSSTRGVALQRHAVRLGPIKQATFNISGSEKLVSKTFTWPSGSDAGVTDAALGDAAEAGGDEDAGEGDEDAGEGDRDEDADVSNCPEGYYHAEATALVCPAANPWFTRSLQWTATYRGAFTTLISGATLSPVQVGDEDGLLLSAPAGIDLCERGAAPAGLAIQIRTQPPEGTPNYCKHSQTAEFWRFPVVQAFSDHLVITPDTEGVSRDQVLNCFPQFVDFDLRFDDSWRISVGSANYPHRIKAAEDGACEVDTTLDPRLNASADFSRPYVDPFIAFQLKAPDGKLGPDEKSSISPSVAMSVQASPLSVSIVTGNRSDTLPARMRWFSPSGYLFVVDAASQGLAPIRTWPQLQVDTSYH